MLFNDYFFQYRSLYDICRPALEREVSRVEVTDELRQEILDGLDRGKLDDKEAAGLWRHLAAAGIWKPKDRKVRSLYQSELHKSGLVVDC